MSVRNKVESGKKIVSQNRKARHDFFIVETVEAGLSLLGEEIKSIRTGEVSLAESYIRPLRGELFLINAHINKYSMSGNLEYDPLRPRKLLLSKHEIGRLIRQVEAKGMTIVPLELHLRNGWAKLEIALAKGKSAPDRRDSVRERESRREMDRATKVRRG